MQSVKNLVVSQDRVYEKDSDVSGVCELVHICHLTSLDLSTDTKYIY